MTLLDKIGKGAASKGVAIGIGVLAGFMPQSVYADDTLIYAAQKAAQEGKTDLARGYMEMATQLAAQRAAEEAKKEAEQKARQAEERVKLREGENRQPEQENSNKSESMLSSEAYESSLSPRQQLKREKQIKQEYERLKREVEKERERLEKKFNKSKGKDRIDKQNITDRPNEYPATFSDDYKQQYITTNSLFSLDDLPLIHNIKITAETPIIK